MIYVLLISLILLLFIVFIMNKKDIFSPSCIFIIAFIFSCFWACLYEKEWNLQEMQFCTFLVILLGCVDFFIFSFIISLIKNKNIIYDKNNELEYININIFYKLIILAVCLITVLWTAKSLLDFTGLDKKYVLEAINQYKQDNTFAETEGMQFNKILKGLRLCVSATGYFFIYVIINNFLSKKKIDFLSIGIVLVTMLSSIETGGRSSLMNQILVALMTYILLLRKRNKEFKVIRFKQLIEISLLCLVILFTFQKSLALMGRKTYSTPLYYIAYYCGAEIKNLDLYLQDRYNDNEIWGSQTFINLIRWFGKKLGTENHYYQLDLPYRRVGNLNLGNVYTTFYAYIYDFGYFGEFVLVAIMASISQYFYIQANRKNKYMSVLIYSYIFSGISMSFFSNRFYEQLFNMNFVYFVILWFFMDLFLVKLKFKIRNNIN